MTKQGKGTKDHLLPLGNWLENRQKDVQNPSAFTIATNIIYQSKATGSLSPLSPPIFFLPLALPLSDKFEPAPEDIFYFWPHLVILMGTPSSFTSMAAYFCIFCSIISGFTRRRIFLYIISFSLSVHEIFNFWSIWSYSRLRQEIPTWGNP